MFELKNNHGVNDEPVGESPEMAAEIDPFASLNKMLEENPEFKNTFDSVMSILGDDAKDEDGTEVECVEIDGHDYIVAKKSKWKELPTFILQTKMTLWILLFKRSLLKMEKSTFLD